MRIVLGNSSLARYPRGGGHWTVRLQYLLGLRDLGHDVVLLELLLASGEPARDEQRIETFFRRLGSYGLEDCGALLLFEQTKDANGGKVRMDDIHQDIDAARSYGRSRERVKEAIRNADMLWNDCCGIRQPLLGMFRHRVLLDLDPGHLQISALDWDMDIHHHQAFLSVGAKVGEPDCDVPTLGVTWHTFTPFVYLPLWEVSPDPGLERPFTSVTHWSWGELSWKGRALSLAKRDGYLPYAELPERSGRAFELAVRFDPSDTTGDREQLLAHGWGLADPWEVAASPPAYQAYIAASRAEISCPKPIFRELNTGWFSDRSACYLASGRPVLAHETGFSDRLPTGTGLLSFRNMDEAVRGVAEIDAHYSDHMRAARRLAEEFLDSRRCLGRMLSACV
jgi:hypothetical protein